MGKPPRRNFKVGNRDPRKRGLSIWRRDLGKQGCAVLVGIGGTVITAAVMLGHKLGTLAYALLAQ